MKKAYGNLFVVLVYILLTSSYYVYVGLIFWPQSESLQGSLVLFVFHAVFALQQWSLITVIFADPGAVPLHWGFHVGDSESKRRRYCLMCHVFKPERCHHCSACNRCVLNMDHHCPWINNCVGFNNRKAFLLTLFYSSLLAITIAVGSLPSAYDAVWNLQYEPAWPGLSFIGVELCSVFFTVILTAFLRFHLRLVLQNLTTIENLEKNEVRHNYSAGPMQNWCQVFGANPWLWFLPIFGKSGKPAGDGVHWAYTSTEVLESSMHGGSDRAETPRLKLNSVINPSLTASKADIEIIKANSIRGRFFVAQSSEIDTDTSFLNSRPRSALAMAPETTSELKVSQETLNATGMMNGVTD